MSEEKKFKTKCSRPVKRNGVYVRCGSSDYATCQGCAALNSLDTKKIIGSGLKPEGNYYLLTLTAPSWGKIHTTPHRATDEPVRCACGALHEWNSPLSGTPVSPKRYDYKRSVEWNANSGELFRRTMDYLGRVLPGLEWCAVREYQRRTALHYHVLIRLPRSLSATDSYLKLKKANSYKSPKARWGRTIDVRLIEGSGEESVRYLSKVVGYAAKALGKSANLASEQQRQFFSKLDQVGQDLELTDKAIAGYGYGGQLQTHSSGWTDLTKKKLKEERAQWAKDNPSDETQSLYAELEAENVEHVRQMSESLGSSSDYSPNLEFGKSIRDRLST